MTTDAVLEIDNPLASCSHCRFTARLAGEWSVEEGRLVFRAAADPQPGRGPDLNSCCESSPAVTITHVRVDDEYLSDQQLSDLRDCAAGREA